MRFNQTGSNTGNSPFGKRSDNQFSRWEKSRADGKWFWLFKRSAVWLTAAIVLFGVFGSFFPETIRFEGTHLFIAVFMFAGYFAGSLNEWSKMEKFFQSEGLPNE